MSDHIKTWQERGGAPDNASHDNWTGIEEDMAAEIAELRAALAASEHTAWCAGVNADGAREELAEIKAAAPLPQQAAGDAYAAAEFASWKSVSLSYRAFCNGCPYCFWECTSQFKQPTLSWDEVGFDQT